MNDKAKHSKAIQVFHKKKLNVLTQQHPGQKVILISVTLLLYLVSHNQDKAFYHYMS